MSCNPEKLSVAFFLALLIPGSAEAVGRGSGSVLSVGDLSSCALLRDGTANCWGANDFGQLGIGTVDSTKHLPAPVSGLNGAVSIGIGRYFGCALTAGGNVQCWGSNGRGWLGDNTTTDHYVPAPIKDASGRALVGIKALSVGRNHSCAVDASGSLFCWGSNSNGQLGNGTTADSWIPAQAGSAPGLGFVDVAVGQAHTCALASDGSVWCWGNNAAGQLGDGTNSNSALPVRSLIANARAVTAGSTHSCAVRVDGTVACWGSDNFHETGSCGKGSCTISTANAMSNAKAVSAGAAYTCALSANGSVYCWGRNDSNQLGGAYWGSPGTAVLIGNLNAVAISAGASTVCVANANGTVQCWGDNQQGEAGDGTRTQYSAANPNAVHLTTAALGSASAMTAGSFFSCASSAGGTSKCWGDNAFDELGNSTTTSSPWPTQTAPLASWPTALSSGNAYSCALESDASIQCWGTSGSGAIGNGSNSPASVPSAVGGAYKNHNAIAISAGYDFALALLSDGSILSWGDNSYGELGNGSSTSSSLPVTVMNSANTIAVAAGGYHACALLYNGTVWCWGYNGYGQLGTGNYNNASLAVATLPLAGKAIAISAGWYHTCALLDNGNLQCWGYNGYGQLGNGSAVSTPSPVAVADSCAHSVCTVNAGALTNSCDNVATQVCAIDSYCCTYQWDSICVGEVSSIAQQDCAQGINRAVVLSLGGYDTCAVNPRGALSCWGANWYGELGDGTTTNRSYAWQTVSLANASSVSPGIYSSCASKTDGSQWCWGYNGYGEVGDGTHTQRNAPVSVTSF